MEVGSTDLRVYVLVACEATVQHWVWHGVTSTPTETISFFLLALLFVWSGLQKKSPIN